MSNAIYLDLGPESTFLGYPTRIAGKKVCVLSSRAAENAERVRQFMRAQGRDCGTCGGCPIGRAS